RNAADADEGGALRVGAVTGAKHSSNTGVGVAFQAARRSRPERAALHLLLAVAALGAVQPGAPPADTILVNGHVITVDSRFSIAQPGGPCPGLVPPVRP